MCGVSFSRRTDFFPRASRRDRVFEARAIPSSNRARASGRTPPAATVARPSGRDARRRGTPRRVMSASTFTFSAAVVGGARVQSKVRERRVKLNRRDDDDANANAARDARRRDARTTRIARRRRRWVGFAATADDEDANATTDDGRWMRATIG